MPWPKRYEVTIESATGTGPAIAYPVVTWLHQEKAIALAVVEHSRRFPESRIYEVAVKSLGPAGRDASGTVTVGGDLHDRYEF
jgi:hypothetical protein